MIKQYWNVQHIRNGNVIWEENYKHNSLANEGASMILKLVYQNQSSLIDAPANFYVRLCNYSPVVTDTLATIQSEPSGNGYVAQTVPASTAGFPVTDVAPDGNPRLTSAVITFTADGGDIGPVTTAYLATTIDNTGLLVAFLPLSMQRTILDGDSMTYQFFVEEGNS
jgi:hypothetical protein